MNIGNIKSFLSGQDVNDPRQLLNKTLQEQGLKQAEQGLNVDKSSIRSSITKVGYTALEESLRVNVRLDGEIAQKSSPDASNQLFDFEEIANNVMAFVGSVIRGAAESGADDKALNLLFDQASAGIAQGIDMAREELSGMMTETIDQGIDNADKALQERLLALKEEIFSPAVDSAPNSTEVSVSETLSSELIINTRDGDTVRLVFGEQKQAYFNENEAGVSAGYLQRQGMSFSVQGELAEEELKSISALVESVNAVADEFFYGDVEQAFERAKEFGYDDEQLVGFAMRLTKTSSFSAVRAYQDVNEYSDDDQAKLSSSPDMAKIKNYIDNMLNSLNSASELLQSDSDYRNIINELVNAMGEEVKIPDLLSAVNRFYAFNKNLIQAMPSAESVASPESKNSD